MTPSVSSSAIGVLFTLPGSTLANQLFTNLANGVSPFAGFDTAAMGTSLGNQLGGYFGTLFGQHVMPARSPEAALFASAAAIIGSLVLSEIPIVGPAAAANHNVAEVHQVLAFIRSAVAA